MSSPKWFIIRVLTMVSALFLIIYSSYVLRGGRIQDFFGGDARQLDNETSLDWCEDEIDYVRVNAPGTTASQPLDLSDQEKQDICSLLVTGYRPDEVIEDDFKPLVLVRYTNGENEVFEWDGRGHYRFRGLIFRSDELSIWLDDL